MLDDPALDDMIAKFAVDEGLLRPEDVERARATQPGPGRLTETLKAQGSLSQDQIERLVRKAARPITTVTLSEKVQSALHDPKRRVGKYVLVEEIGRGGMGIVHRAWDTTLERHVAVKCLPASANAEDLARFRREAQTAAKINHPNIVPVHEILEHEGSVFVVMELIDGKRLDEAAAEPRDIAVAIRDAANAIHFAHGKGIVHRDLKPANIMRDASGRVWVMDFGLARPVSRGTTLTATGIIQGTPSYMSPEHATAAPFTPAADVYSLGATLYDLLTGELPFKGENPLDILRQIVHDDPVPPRSIKPSIAPDLETITLKCLEKKPERRYRTAEELAQDLDRWLKGEAILAHPPSTLYRVVRFVQRRRVPIAGALVVLAAAGWMIGSAIQTSARVQAFVESGRAAESSGALEAARDAFRRAADLAPRNAGAREGLERVEGVLRDREQRLKDEAAAALAKLKAREEASALLETARAALDRAARMRREPGSYSKVIQAVDPAQEAIGRALQKAPDLAVGQHLLGIAWSLKGEDADAERCWRKAVELDPAYAAPHLELGRLAMFRVLDASLEGAPEERARHDPAATDTLLNGAAKEMEDYVRLAGTSGPPQLTDLARTMQALAKHDTRGGAERIDEAVAKYGQAEGMEEFFWLDAMFVSHGERAGRALTRAIELRPNYFEALFLRGDDLFEQGEYGRAAQDLSKAIAIKPKYAPAWMKRGLAFRKMKDFDRALSDFDHAGELAPDDAFVLLNRGVVRLDLKDPEQARALFTELLKREPDWAPAYELRGTARAMATDFKGALEDYTKALDIHPTSRAYLNRGQNYLDLDDRASALKDFEMGAALAPEDSQIRKDCLRLIETLKPKSF